MTDDRPRPRWRHPNARISALVLLGAFGLLLTACGGGPSASPGIAHLGSSSTTTIPPTSEGGSSPVRSVSSAKLLAYTRCMRNHGIADFPDPTVGPGGQGGGFRIKVQPGSDLNPRSPRFQAANQACKKLLPFGGESGPPTAAQLAGLTKFAACMRQHGFPSFPDPNGQGTFVLHNIDPGGSPFQSAQRTCNSIAHYSGPMRIRATSSGPAGR